MKKSLLEEPVPLGQQGAAADEGSTGNNVFGPAATMFINTYVVPFVVAKDDNKQRKRIIANILETSKNESQLDSDWWTEKNIMAKLKKLAAKHRRAAGNQ